MSLFLLSGFCLPSSGLVYKKQKQRNPDRVVKDSYDKKDHFFEKYRYLILKSGEYPWGVCFPKGDHNYPQWALNWTYEAMQRWNQRYKDYVDRYIERRGFGKLEDPFSESFTYHPTSEIVHFYSKIVGWPQIESGTLFVWSCNSGKYNLIFPEFGPPKDNDPNNLAYHKPIDPFFGSFYGKIVMSNLEKWEEDKEKFINVKIHELGHALGIPHLKEHQTDIMLSHGFGCGEDEICELSDGDFKSFLEPYGELREESGYVTIKCSKRGICP